MELSGTVVSEPDRRDTPAGTPVASFRLRVEPDPNHPTLTGCEIPVVLLGPAEAFARVESGSRVLVEGALAERRWTRRGLVQRRFEVVAASVRLV